MDPPAARGPKSYERRYTAIDPEVAAIYYLFRKHLHYTTEEVQGLPWWKLRMYAEQMLKDLSPPDEDDAVPDHVEERDDLSAFGITPHSLK